MNTVNNNFQSSFADFRKSLSSELGIISKEADNFNTNLLSEEQLDAVQADESKVIIVAGAGSGKTRVVSERVKYLLEVVQVDPSSIVVITYTNLAAEELRSRIKPNLDDTSLNKMFIGTIHSFANKVLKSSGEDYTLWTIDNMKYQTKLLVERFGRYSTPEDVDTYFEMKNDLRLAKISETFYNAYYNSRNAYNHSRVDIYEELSILTDMHHYTKRYPDNLHSIGKRFNYITFNELIRRTSEYCKDNDITIEHLIVDEFQDISDDEFEFFESLDSKNNYYVGDDWQAIYGFKGSNCDIFKSLCKSKEYTRYDLSNNYRNAFAIMEYASIIIEQVMSKVDKKVIVNNPDVGSVQVGNTSELYRVAKLDILKDRDFRNYAILTRSNRDATRVGKILAEMKIPHLSLQEKSRYNESELRSILNSDRVKVMTVHQAKGLEFPKVILYGVSFDTVVPSWKLDKVYKSDEHYEEERRIMYVGCTRAIDKLYVLNGGN